MLISPLRYKSDLILWCAICSAILIGDLPAAESETDPELSPIVRVVDLNVGESNTVTLSNGERIQVKLLGLKEARDPVRHAVRSAIVTVEVDGKSIELESGMYNLPQTIGRVQIDCSITGGYNSNGTPAFWGVEPLNEDGYAITKHIYQKPGDYLVKVERSREDGVTAVTRLHVHVNPAE